MVCLIWSRAEMIALHPWRRSVTFVLPNTFIQSDMHFEKPGPVSAWSNWGGLRASLNGLMVKPFSRH